MLKVHLSEKWQPANSAESFFNTHLACFDFESNRSYTIFRMFGRNVYLGGHQVRTPYGAAHITEIPTATKLALCLVQFPSALFDGRSICAKSLEKILNLPDGNLLMGAMTSLPYYFPIQVMTDERVIFEGSTDLMIYLKRRVARAQ